MSGSSSSQNSNTVGGNGSSSNSSSGSIIPKKKPKGKNVIRLPALGNKHGGIGQQMVHGLPGPMMGPNQMQALQQSVQHSVQNSVRAAFGTVMESVHEEFKGQRLALEASIKDIRGEMKQAEKKQFQQLQNFDKHLQGRLEEANKDANSRPDDLEMELDIDGVLQPIDARKRKKGRKRPLPKNSAAAPLPKKKARVEVWI